MSQRVVVTAVVFVFCGLACSPGTVVTADPADAATAVDAHQSDRLLDAEVIDAEAADHASVDRWTAVGDASPLDRPGPGDGGQWDHDLTDGTGPGDVNPLDRGPADDLGVSADASALPDSAQEDGSPASCTLDAGACAELLACQQRYPGTLGLVGAALAARLKELIGGNRTVDYDDESKDQLYGNNNGVGLDAVDGGIYCRYTGQVLGDDYNCEHTWPQSDFDERVPMVGDLHHLFAVDSTANNRRSNLHFGVVDALAPGDSSWVWPEECPCADSDPKACCSVLGDSVSAEVSRVFEPRNDAKGDIARALMYFAVRYADRDINSSRPAGTGPAPANRIPSFEEEVLRVWHVQDPVSERERIRQDRVEAIQGNRNPFIDCPVFVELIEDF